MAQPRNIFSLAAFFAAALLLPTQLAAQNYVTPVVMPTPPGTLITVNNTAGGQHIEPRVDGDVVCYTNEATPTLESVRYFNLATRTEGAVPSAFDGSQDIACDARRTAVVFTRSGADASIFAFDTASAGLTEFDPTSGSQRFGVQIGDQTIVWQDSSSTTQASSIMAFDRTSATTTVISPAAAPPINQNAGISPDGSIVVWESCVSLSQCVIWKAVRLSSGAWKSQQLASQFPGGSHPDTDGAIIAYSSASSCPACAGASSANGQLAWQPVTEGTRAEQVLSLPGSATNPNVSGGLIAFTYDATASGSHQIALYDTRSNFLYDLPSATNSRVIGATLNDISVTPDGNVRVVWQEFDANANQFNVYAYVFNLQGDFNFGAISPLTIAAGASASANVTVDPLNGFSGTVNLSATDQPAGVTASASPNQVTPSGGNSATSILNVTLPDFITPTNFTLTVTGTSGALSHSTTANVTVTATSTSIGNLIGDLLGAGCIDNGGIANALTSKLSAAQSAAAAGSIQTAINTLTALKNQINVQAGKHIATACTIARVAFNPVMALLLDVQSLIDSLRVSLTPDPLTGYVVDGNGGGVPGVVVSILDASGSTVIATATDITGFYFFATTGGVLSPGVSYTLQVSVPVPFSGVMPATQPFQWQGTTGIAFANFVLN